MQETNILRSQRLCSKLIPRNCEQHAYASWFYYFMILRWALETINSMCEIDTYVVRIVTRTRGIVYGTVTRVARRMISTTGRIIKWNILLLGVFITCNIVILYYGTTTRRTRGRSSPVDQMRMFANDTSRLRGAIDLMNMVRREYSIQARRPRPRKGMSAD